MLKIIKMISLCALATMVADPSLCVPSRLTHKNARIHHVTVTAYTNHPKCTGPSVNLTASSSRISPKDYGSLIALSRDIAKQHTFGDRFQLLVKDTVYKVSYLDRMPKKHSKKVDLLLPSLKSCKEFGRQQGVLIEMEQT